MLPNFLIVGAPKAGTTSLYHYLEKHPQVFMPSPKELNFFSREEMESQNLFYSDVKIKSLKLYEKKFEKGVGKKAVGEASVSYLFYPQTPQKIKSAIPSVKIIILLRNPIERGISHYWMDYRLGLVKLSYDKIVFQKNEHKNKLLYYQQYVELGLYYEQVKRYFDFFGPKQTHVYLSEDFQQDPHKVVQDICCFLGIDQLPQGDSEEKNSYMMPKNKWLHFMYSDHRLRTFISKAFPIALKGSLKRLFFNKEEKPVIAQSVRAHLKQIYSSDILRLQKLIDRDLSRWGL